MYELEAVKNTHVQSYKANSGEGNAAMNTTEESKFEKVLSAQEASDLLGIHPVTLLRWAREGRIPHRRLGRKVTFRASELDSWYRTQYTCPAVRVAQP